MNIQELEESIYEIIDYYDILINLLKLIKE